MNESIIIGYRIMSMEARVARLESNASSSSYASLIKRQRTAFDASMRAHTAEMHAFVVAQIALEARQLRAAAASSAPLLAATASPLHAALSVRLDDFERAFVRRRDDFELTFVRRTDVESMLALDAEARGASVETVVRSGLTSLSTELQRAVESTRREIAAVEAKVEHIDHALSVSSRQHVDTVDALKDEVLSAVDQRSLETSSIETAGLTRLRKETVRISMGMRKLESAVAKRAVAGDVERALRDKVPSSALAMLRSECEELRREVEQQRVQLAQQTRTNAARFDDSAAKAVLTIETATAAARKESAAQLDALRARINPLERECCCARWLWRGDHSSSSSSSSSSSVSKRRDHLDVSGDWVEEQREPHASAAAWASEQTNTHPALFQFGGPGSTVILVATAGLYRLTVGCFSDDDDAPFDVIVNDQVILRRVPMANPAVQRVAGHRSGTLTGMTLNETTILPKNATVQVCFSADFPGAQGFLGLDKL